MAYVSAEQSKKFRETIKREFSGKDNWKISVTRDHYSLKVVILTAPIDFGVEKEKTVCHKWVADHYEGDAAAALQRIIDICNEGNHDNSDIMTDYFDVGWYFTLSIGDWDRPFQFIAKEGYTYQPPTTATAAPVKPIAETPAPIEEPQQPEMFNAWAFMFDDNAIDSALNSAIGFVKSNKILENDLLIVTITPTDLCFIDKNTGTKILLNEKTTPAHKIFDMQPLNEFYFELFCLFNNSLSLPDVLEILHIYNAEK